MNKFYVSTAIPYVNAEPHLGFALEIVQTDVIARYHRLLGEDVFFLTGTDENSLKNVRAAEKEGIAVKDLVDRNAKIYYALKDALNLSFDDFIRTTKSRHVKGANKLWLTCKKDIYRKNYAGLYCAGCEEFYREGELEDGLCPEHKTKPEQIEEENYFFKLSAYQEELKRIIKKDEVQIIPETRKNEVLSFIERGLEDICISRSVERAHGWGIPVSEDPAQVIWVWFDALSNYINALGYGEGKAAFQDWWVENEKKLHVIGKGVLRFHAIYWPAILLSAKLSLPAQIFVHGYITINGQKLSKSLGNIIDPFALVEEYGADAVRYFLLREILSTEDGDFTREKFEARFNADLANDLGNLVSRTLTMVEKYFEGNIPQPRSSGEARDKSLMEKASEAPAKVEKAMARFEFNNALVGIWELVNEANRYIEDWAPWELSKDKDKQDILGNVLYNLAESLRIVALLVLPFMPATAAKIWRQLGIEGDISRESLTGAKEWGSLKVDMKVKKGSALFPRISLGEE